MSEGSVCSGNSDETMSRGHRIQQLMHELQHMPEYQFHTEMEDFWISVYIFEQNYKELREVIGFLESDPRADSLFTMKNRDKLNARGREVIRRLHNFVAAAMSLIDHTRRLYDKLYAGNNSFPDYKDRVERDFASDPLSQFVKCLRQYCQH